ncbi:MAG: arylsulfatase [Phycisphaeraceae bacterium]
MPDPFRPFMRWLCLLIFGSFAGLPVHAEQRPDILLIMADDLGYADLGCYGSEIDTPNLDGLAEQGVRFTHFRVEPMCVVTRIALMAGRPFNAGADHAYTRTTPFPKQLKAAGYDTHMTGKWHAGKPNPRNNQLFNQFYGFMGGMTDSYAGGPDWFQNQRRITDFPKDWYATDAITDYAIDFMKASHDQGKPTFTFVSYNAPHHPCQAPKETVEKYQQRYLAGYEKIRNTRLERQRVLGVIDKSWQPATHGSEARQWDELPKERQRVEADRMAAYAATIDEIDQSVGRLIAYLKQADRLDNTLILFLSDNGGDYNNGARTLDAKQIPWLPGNNPTSSNAWAWVKNTPFRSYKHASHEGALASPLIAHWPKGLAVKSGSLIHEAAHVTDLYPTLLDLAGTDYPKRDGDKELLPLTGSSLLPLLQGKPEKRRDLGQFSWYNHSRAWTKNGWKAVRLYDGPWQLYNLNTDRGETNDLAKKHPKKLLSLIKEWRSLADPKAMQARPAPGTQLTQRGWGWHRLQMICGNQLLDLKPNNSDTAPSASVQLALEFSAPIDFANNQGKSIRLFAVSDESKPVWQLSPDKDHPAQGKNRVVFDAIPELEPGTAYFVEWDAGWASVGGKPLGPLNDGAYWWRFRTPKAE